VLKDMTSLATYTTDPGSEATLLASRPELAKCAALLSWQPDLQIDIVHKHFFCLTTVPLGFCVFRSILLLPSYQSLAVRPKSRQIKRQKQALDRAVLKPLLFQNVTTESWKWC
jgi:hypothetical protein